MDIPTLKKDAVIEIKLGAGIIAEIQSLLIYLVQKNDMKTLKDKLDKGENLTGEEAGIVTLTRLRRVIENIARETGQLYNKDIEEAVAEILKPTKA